MIYSPKTPSSIDRRDPAHDKSRHSGRGRCTLPQANVVDRGRVLRQPRHLVLQSRSLLDRLPERGYQRLGFLGREPRILTCLSLAGFVR